MSELSNKTREYWEVKEQVSGADCVSARLGQKHLNLYICGNDGKTHIEIPYLTKTKISDTRLGVLASSS